MGISVFEIIAEAAGAFNINDLFITDIEFTDVPDGTTRVIQVQIETDQAATLQVTTTGGTSWSALNNNTPVDGLATFTMIVRKDDTVNFRNVDVAGLAVKITVVG